MKHYELPKLELIDISMEDLIVTSLFDEKGILGDDPDIYWFGEEE